MTTAYRSLGDEFLTTVLALVLEEGVLDMIVTFLIGEQIAFHFKFGINFSINLLFKITLEIVTDVVSDLVLGNILGVFSIGWALLLLLLLFSNCI